MENAWRVGVPMALTKASKARQGGRCSRPDCPKGGTVQPGELARWVRLRDRNAMYHDRCHPAWVGVPVGVEFATEDTATSRAGRANGGDLSNVTRGCGGLFEQEETEPMITPPVNTHQAPRAGGDSYLSGLAEALSPYLHLEQPIDADEVREIIDGVLDGTVLQTVTRVEIRSERDGEIRDMGIQHSLFPLLLNACQARTSDGFRLNIWLTGPAGSGKTTAAKSVALALGLPFRFTGSIDTEYKLMGFIDAQGRIVNTQFRQAYENGGVFLFDEVDSSLPAALLAFNAALANGEAAFPDAIVNRHKDFICIAAANTWGLGANSEYVGRLKLDAAFLDRFVQLAWSVDEGLELATAGNPVWVARVQSLRKNAQAKGLKAIISPRASYFGAALLASGMAQDLVEILAVRKAMSADQWGA